MRPSNVDLQTVFSFKEFITLVTLKSGFLAGCFQVSFSVTFLLVIRFGFLLIMPFLLFLFKIKGLPPGVPPYGGGAGFLPGQGGGGLLLLLHLPGVQGEVDGGADGEGAGEGDALVGQLLADFQELHAKGSFTVTGRHPRRQG